MNRKTLTLLVALISSCLSLGAQQTYWVMLANKAGTTFDPYAYFDPKAIARYALNGADLYDSTNYPVSPLYVEAVAAEASEVLGESRWLNAIGICATPEQAEAIASLPFVSRMVPLGAVATLASYADEDDPSTTADSDPIADELCPQLQRMGAEHFQRAGIDGHGVRIAVFDAGFPMVDKHPAFSHLRDSNRIVATWNFPRKKADVYGWNSHGTMTLSCIAGRRGHIRIGMATGAEFLLARTEVNAEPSKEEVWWQMAVEWADRHGADIISSSLGYGKERYTPAVMDGTSLVARAANMAARKGILVCNSAGNEDDVAEWRTIITPADADSVLCVGGITNSLTEYKHISFSSLGPSADGRQKPNVVAFGHARVANPSKSTPYSSADGTSFSCPLVAGFAACAWQASPGKTAMQMFDLIQRSADLYPYCDYAYGYGVPQASYFVGKQPSVVQPTFRFEVNEGITRVVPTHPLRSVPFFYKEVDADGKIVRYGNQTLAYFDTNNYLRFNPQPGVKLVVHAGGYTDSILATASPHRLDAWPSLYIAPDGIPTTVENSEFRNAGTTRPSRWGNCARNRYDIYFHFGLNIATSSSELSNNLWSPQGGISMRFLRAYAKWYCLGIDLGCTFGLNRFNGQSTLNDLETQLSTSAITLDPSASRRRVSNNEVSLELFQRIRFVALGLGSKGLHWDVGVYGSVGTHNYQYITKAAGAEGMHSLEVEMVHPKALSHHTFNYGVSTRLTYDLIGIYARYRLNGLGADDNKVYLPRLAVGLQLSF